MSVHMSSWKDQLTDAQFEQIITWLQSRWPDELYANWVAMDQKTR